MNKLYLIIGIFFSFSVLSPTTTALFTPSYDLTGTLTNETQTFFIGKTILQGTFTGYPVSNILNSSIVKDMGGFPIVGTSSISDLRTVIVGENIDITAADSLENLLDLQSAYFTTYTNVSISTEDGLFLFGISHGNLTVSKTLKYAVTTFLPLEIIPNTMTRFFATVTSTPLTMHGSGEYAVLTTLSENGTIRLMNRQGATVWRGSSQETLLIIENHTFFITQHPPLSLFPLADAPFSEEVVLSVAPADPEDIVIRELLTNLSAVTETLDHGTSSGLLNILSNVDSFIKTTSFMLNGAMMLLRSNDTLTIDQSIQQPSSNGFIRFRTLDITTAGSSSRPTLQADCKLCFLGTHFYNPRAQQSADGIRFPFELLIIWIFALCIFVYVRFIIRPSVIPLKDERIKRYALIIHIVALVAAFLLVDMEVNDLFGISACTALITQGASMVTGTFLFLEGILWMLGFLLLALPIQLLSYAVLRYFGYGKGGKGVWKAVGDLFIWIFCGLYLLLFTNFILSLIHLNVFVPMG